MSADILFVRKPAWAPKWVARLRGVLGKHDPLGTGDSVKATISELFPQTRWREEQAPLPLPGPAGSSVPWFGSGPPEFQLFAAPDGTVTVLFASRIAVHEIRMLERKLKAVAINMQGESVLGFIFR